MAAGLPRLPGKPGDHAALNRRRLRPRAHACEPLSCSKRGPATTALASRCAAGWKPLCTRPLRQLPDARWYPLPLRFEGPQTKVGSSLHAGACGGNLQLPLCRCPLPFGCPVLHPRTSSHSFPPIPCSARRSCVAWLPPRKPARPCCAGLRLRARGPVLLCSFPVHRVDPCLLRAAVLVMMRRGEPTV